MREQPDPVLAALLKRLREERSVTQEQLAFDSEITVSALSRIERGLNSPGWTTLKKIAKALKVSLVEIAAAVEGVGPEVAAHAGSAKAGSASAPHGAG